MLLWSKNNTPPTNSSTSSAENTTTQNSDVKVTSANSRDFVDLYKNQTCEVEGETFIGINAQYKCQKRNGSSQLYLSMNNGRPIPAPAPLIRPKIEAPTNLVDLRKSVNTSFQNSSVCKVKEKSGASWLPNATAFPFRPTGLSNKGKLDIALVYVDWADSPGTKEDYDFYQKQVKLLKDFYWMVSEKVL